MIFKIVGSATVLLCGALYAKYSQKGIADELSEAERLVGVFRFLKNEIEEFDTPLYEILKSKNIDGGIDGLIASVTSSRLREIIFEAKKLGRGYKKEELRICDRLVTRLEDEKKSLEAKAKETRVISKVKGYGVAAAVVILLV